MVVLVLLVLLPIVPVQAESGILTGLSRLSCEALLCLSSGLRPSPCIPSLNYYFAIKKFSWVATVSARKLFLNQCPGGNAELVSAIAEGAVQCDEKILLDNLNNLSRYIGVAKDEELTSARYRHLFPKNCLIYFSHPLTTGFRLPLPGRDCSQTPLPLPFSGGFYQHQTESLHANCRLTWSWPD